MSSLFPLPLFLDSLGKPVALELGPTANPLFANQASKSIRRHLMYQLEEHGFISVRSPPKNAANVFVMREGAGTLFAAFWWLLFRGGNGGFVAEECGLSAGASLGGREFGGIKP